MEWSKAEERPLVTKDENGNWTCTEDGDKQFIAAVSYTDNKRPDNLWWIRHCVIEDGIGLCVVGDDDNEPAGWQIEDVAYWMPWVTPPTLTPAHSGDELLKEHLDKLFLECEHGDEQHRQWLKDKFNDYLQRQKK